VDIQEEGLLKYIQNHLEKNYFILLPKLKSGWIAAFIDAEHAFDRNYAEKLGVDIENLIISQRTMESNIRNCRKLNSFWSY
jgi:RecA/RadA recombinase